MDAASDAARDVSPDAGKDAQADMTKTDALLNPGFVSIPAGTFQMGSPSTEPCRFSDETQHQVTLTHTYEIQSTEVTQWQFSSVLGYSPSYFSSCGSDCPVETVSWHEAAAYCNALSAKSGKGACYACTGSGASVTCQEASGYTGAGIYSCPGYRLPTEAEWEHAYRAKTTSAYYNGPNDGSACKSCSIKDANADRIGWYGYNSTVSYAGCYDLSFVGCPKCVGAHPVAKKTANAWGLYDMAGNVHEWCHDWYQQDLGSSPVTDPVGSGSSYRVLRGGSWGSSAKYLRAAGRGASIPAVPTDDIGLRCARTL